MRPHALLRSLLPVALIMLSVTGALAAAAETTATNLHPLRFIDDQNRSRQLAEWKGRLLVVNLWASWCPACVAEMASLQRLQQQFSPERLQVLTLNQDLPHSDAIQATLARYGAEHLPPYRDPGSLFGQAVGQTLLPMTLIVAPDGSLLGQLVGPAAWDSPDAIAAMQRYLGDSL